MATQGRTARYSVHPGVEMAQKTILTLKEKTGRSLEEWKALITRTAPAGDAARIAWLKTEHGLGTNYAKWLSDLSSGKNGEDGDPDAYLAKAEEWEVPLYRAHVFAQIKPTTLTRVDLGLALKGKKPPKRLIDTGGEEKKDRITHRIAISDVSEIDQLVETWMRVAYSD